MGPEDFSELQPALTGTNYWHSHKTWGTNRSPCGLLADSDRSVGVDLGGCEAFSPVSHRPGQHWAWWPLSPAIADFQNTGSAFPRLSHWVCTWFWELLIVCIECLLSWNNCCVHCFPNKTLIDALLFFISEKKSQISSKSESFCLLSQTRHCLIQLSM